MKKLVILFLMVFGSILNAQDSGMFNAGNFGGPVTYGIPNGDDIFFSQGNKLNKGNEGNENIEVVSTSFLLDAATQIKINGDNLYAIYGTNSENKNSITNTTLSNLGSSSSNNFSGIDNGINKFDEIDGFGLLAHNKDGVISDKLVGEDLLGNTNDSFEYVVDFIDFTINEYIAYLITDDGTSNNIIEIIDFSAKTSAQNVGSILVKQAQSVFYSNGYLYVACVNGEGLKIIDVSNSASPTLVGEYSPDTFSQVIVDGTTAYLRNENVLTILYVSDPTNPTFVSTKTFNDISAATKFTAVQSDKIYYVDNGIFGIIEASTLNLGQQYLSPLSSDWVAADETTLVVYDKASYYFHSLEEPSNPKAYAVLAADFEPVDFVINGTDFYATANNKLSIYNIDNLATPGIDFNYFGEFSAFKIADNFAVIGEYKYSASTKFYYFEIIDLSDKSNPTQLHLEEYATIGTITSIELSPDKNTLYLASELEGKIWLAIFDITNKAAPTRVYLEKLETITSDTIDGKDTRLGINGSELYLVTNYVTLNGYNAAKIFAYSVQESSNPRIIAGLQITESEYSNVVFFDENLLVAVPTDQEIHMYSLEGDSTFRKEWNQIETLTLDNEHANMASYLNRTTQTVSPPKGSKFNKILGDEWDYTSVVISEKKKGTELIQVYVKKKVVTKVQLTTSVLPAEAAAGGCSVSPSGGEYDQNSTVSISANAASGWVFDNWSGDLTGSANPANLTMNSDKSVIGNFKPTLTIGFTSVSAMNIAPPKEGEKIYIGTTNLTAGGVDWELHALKYIPLAKIKTQYTNAYLFFNGKVKEGSFTVDGDGYISQINFSITEIIAEGQTLSLKFYYMFTFPQNEKGTLAPLEEVKKLGISINRTLVSCDPVPSIEGIINPGNTFSSNYQTIGWIWNVSLTPNEPFVTFQDAIDDPLTLNDHQINVIEGYYKYESTINVTKSISFSAIDDVVNSIIEVSDVEPTEGLFTIPQNKSVTIDGFTLTGNNEDFGIYTESFLTIKNSILTKFGKAGIYHFGNNNITIDNCKISEIAGDAIGYVLQTFPDSENKLTIKGDATELINNSGHGIFSSNGIVNVFGNNVQIHDNEGWGIRVMEADLYIHDNAIKRIFNNGKGGIIATQSARIPEGFIIEDNDGPGLVILNGDGVVLENIIIRNNKGDGLGFGVSLLPSNKTDILIRGSHNEFVNNKGIGLYITGGNLLIEGTNTKIDGNTGWGIKSMQGNVTIKEKAMTGVSNNGNGGIMCASEGYVKIPSNFVIEKNGGPGLVSMGANSLTLENVKIRENGGDGIGFSLGATWSEGDNTPHLILTGSNNEIINNKGHGIRASLGNILISGTGTQIHDNTGWGIRAEIGSIEIRNGAMQSINSNGQGGLGSFSAGTIKVPRNFIIENNGGIGLLVLDDKPISFWNIKVRDNKGHGLLTMSKNLYIWGGSEFTNNSGCGIYSRFSGNVTISGNDISINNNHKWGVIVENGNADIQGSAQSRIEMNNNVEGGVWVKNGKLKSRNINVLSNFGDGIRCAKNTFVGQAKICSNSGKGIVSGGVTTLEQVNICQNEVTGIYITPTISYADLAVKISGNEGPINVNENIIYNITITNNGPDIAHGVMMKNPLPAGLTFVNISSLNGDSYEQDGTVYCDIGSLTNGSSINIKLTTSASNSGTFINSASVESGMIDNEKDNDIASITTVVTSPLSASLSGYETDKQNQYIIKSDYQKSSTHLSYISNFIKNNPIVYSQVIDDEYTESSISGSIIEGNKNGGILYNSESEFIIENSNMISNSPYGLKNNLPSTIIIATNNYWGNSNGPSLGTGLSNGVVGSVNIDDWLDEKVALTVSAEVDTLLIPKGIIDTVYCFFQNWENSNDVVNVHVTESANWILSSKNFSLSLSDSMGTSSPIVINSPADIASGELNQIYITGISQSDPLETKTDSFFVKIFEPIVSTIVLSPDSVVIAMGDTLQFVGEVKDQFGNILEPNLVWETSSSIINEDGLFIADSSEGIVVISATDMATRVRAETSVLIKSSKRILAGIIVNPDSLTIMPNHDFIFKAKGFDKDGFSIQFQAIWSADGGVIDSLGYFVASESLGYFTIEVSDTSGNIKGYSYIEIALLTDIEEENNIPKTYSLNQNYPNPFNPSTTISYGLPYDSKVRVEIFNILGQRVDVIANGVESAGLHSTLWDAGHLASGIYIIRINATSVSGGDNFVKSIKMLLIK